MQRTASPDRTQQAPVAGGGGGVQTSLASHEVLGPRQMPLCSRQAAKVAVTHWTPPLAERTQQAPVGWGQGVSVQLDASPR